ncbi:thrombospondin type 3 repeat-containing protein [Candidatus Woesearchaeota archaeon]|nr:thrombospondin type 3 repeat-containing protein [Candidatus Woesearchaeota archaeon]
MKKKRGVVCLVLTILFFCINIVAEDIIFYEGYSDGDWINHPSWYISDENESVTIVNGEFISHGTLDEDGRYRTGMGVSLDTEEICNLSFMFKGQLMSEGNPHEGNQILFFINDDFAQRRYDLRIRSGTRYIDGFPINKDKISLGYGEGGFMYDWVVSNFTPLFDQYYIVEGKRLNGTWSLFVNNQLLGKVHENRTCNRFTGVGFFLHGSVIIDDIYILSYDYTPTSQPHPLLQQYSPVLYLHPSELYFPMNVSSMMDNADLRNVWNLYNDTEPTTFDELEGKDKYYFMDYPEVDISAHNPLLNPTLLADYNYTVYGRAATNENNYTALQYYFFYPFNNWYNTHEGDWEYIQIVLDDENNFESASHSFHHLGGDTTSKTSLGWINETHPVVLVGRGSHASYFEWPDYADVIYYIRLVNDLMSIESLSKSGPVLHYKELTLDEPNAYPYELIQLEEENAWLDFPGHWGEVPPEPTSPEEPIIGYISSFGPRGPKFMRYYFAYNRWNDPFALATKTKFEKFILGVLKSPADLHVYDSSGNHVGAIGSEIEANIVGTRFYTGPTNEPEAFLIYGEDENYTINIAGNDNGTINFDFFYHHSPTGGIALFYRNVSVQESTIITVYASSSSYFVMEVDYNGDQIIDYYKIADEVILEGDYIYVLPDIDGDNISDMVDNCPYNHNPAQENSDNDGLGDACDICPYDNDNDFDLDGVCGNEDNCPEISNPEQNDSDSDSIGDVCDLCPYDPNNDYDLDGICGDVDNCPTIFNMNQTDYDNDTIGDSCDMCPRDSMNDIDNDTHCADADNCPTVSNEDQLDSDGDSFGDVCDVCPYDMDNDKDNDGVCADVDNCQNTYNPDQADSDFDELGDLCDICPYDSDNDEDSDGVCGDVDLCPGTFQDETTRLIIWHYAQLDNDTYFETRRWFGAPVLDSQFSLNSTYGCSCQQILEYKPGENRGEKKYGCNIATIFQWIRQKGWAKKGIAT